MRKSYKIVTGILIFIFIISILSDWKNFKAGLFEKSPVIEIVKYESSLNKIESPKGGEF